MGSTPSPPTPPDPSIVSQKQYQTNLQTAQAQAALNNVSQYGPQGSFVYNLGPNGTYTLNESLNPQLQQIQNAVTGAAGNLANASSGMYSGVPNINPSEAVNAAMSMQQQYLQPWFNQQQSVTNSNLQNQGLAPGDAAYDLAQKQLQENQTQSMQGALAQFEPTAFNQQMQSYALPAQTIGMLEGLQPGMQMQQTPQTGIPATDVTGAYQNYQQAMEQNYQAQMQNQSAMMGGLFSIPAALAGGWARGGFQGLGSLAGLAAV